MKFFTRSWAEGDVDDTEVDVIQGLYSEHLSAIASKLPDSVRQLATATNVHDGLVRQVLIDRRSKTFVLRLRCGDLQAGYFDLDLTYLDAEVTPDDPTKLRVLSTDVEVEVLYDEVDVADGDRYVHRLLFWPSAEIEVTFRQLTLHVTPRTDREVTRAGFVEALD